MAYTPIYLTSTDFTDRVVKNFIDASDTRAEKWYEDTDKEIEMLAEAQGVDPDDIDTPLHPAIKKYAIAYFGKLCCFDNIGTNNVDTSQDEKYKFKWDIYAEGCRDLKDQITKPMFTYLNQADGELDPSAYAAIGIPLYRA